MKHTINDVSKRIGELFDKLNERFFNSSLPRPEFYITPTNREYVKFNQNAIAVYNRSISQKYEFNITSTILSMPMDKICAVIIHEMCHMYNQINGVKDTSRGGTYHNSRFKSTAEAHGLIVAKTSVYGYSETAPNSDLISWCNDQFPKNWIDVYRYTDQAKVASTRPHNYRYECQCCGAIARSGKPLFLICGNCGYTMV